MLLLRQCDKSGDNLNLSRQSYHLILLRAKDASSKGCCIWLDQETQIAVFWQNEAQSDAQRVL
jgi:hypothetical protein